MATPLAWRRYLAQELAGIELPPRGHMGSVDNFRRQQAIALASRQAAGGWRALTPAEQAAYEPPPEQED